ncbi:MAG: hypothetical protein ACRD0J_09570 [Acidimicrobiales bacterium]
MTQSPPIGTGLPLIDGLQSLERPTIEDYAGAAAQYIREASRIGPGPGKAAQVRLSKALAQAALGDLRDRGVALSHAVAGERNVGGGLRSAQADLSEVTHLDGLTLAVEIKPVHLAVGRAIWNRFGDIRTFAVNIHLKFPFAVVGGIMTLPTAERARSGSDSEWKPTTHLVTRAVDRLIRAGGRETEGDAAHLLEGIAVLVFDHVSGRINDAVPPPGSNLRWPEFIANLATAHNARFGDI